MKDKYMKNGVFSLEYDKETLKDMVLELQEVIDKIKEWINIVQQNKENEHLEQQLKKQKKIIDGTKEAIQNMMYYGYFVSDTEYLTPQNEDTIFGIRAKELLKILEDKEVDSNVKD